MTILGVDITSAPGPRKPVTIAEATLVNEVLTFRHILEFTSVDATIRHLSAVTPARIGLDLPLGMPAAFRASVGSESEWDAWLRTHPPMDECVTRTRAYRGPEGQRELFRPCDRLARACSPMKMFYTPVGRMFYRWFPPLIDAPLSLIPARPRAGFPEVREIYPALVAEALAGSRSYKAEDPRKDSPARKEVRIKIWNTLRAGRPLPRYGLTTRLPDEWDLARDSRADRLDAVLAAVATAWASRPGNDQPPAGTDPREGWIFDPSVVS